MENIAKEDRAATGLKKAKELKDWFEGRALPTVPVKLAPHLTLVNAKKFVETQLATLEAYKPLTTVWNEAFLRLYNLKQFLNGTGNIKH